MERVYLSEWLYNAGILGFLNINSHIWKYENGKLISQNENILRFGDNYIEFDKNIFEGFSERFFDYAFNQYGRYNARLELLKSYVKDIENNPNDKEALLKKYNDLKKLLDSFTLLKNKLNIPKKSEINKNPETIKEILNNAISIMKKEKREFWESDVQIYLRSIYGQKSFLNKNVNKDRYNKFYKDYEEQFINNTIQKDKKYRCISCMERNAKKDTIFDTGLSIFYGLNKDAVNFVWNFNPKLPLCEICEIIYFSYFAGFIPVKSDGKTVYYFVNTDSSIEDLVRNNLLLKEKLESDVHGNFLLDFFTEIILEASTEKAKYYLQNIIVLEVDLTNETMPQVHSFNLSKKKAEFLRKEDTKEKLKGLSRTYYQIKDTKVSILPEMIKLILKNKLGFGYLNKLIRYLLVQQGNSRNYKTNVSAYKLQEINILITRFKTDVLGGKSMQTKDSEMWFIYKEGASFAEMLRAKNAENKIQGISYKLLNALRIGDINQFMDMIIRIYMSYNRKIPSSFIKTLPSKEVFYTFGYSFLNGLLSNIKEENRNE